MKGSLIRGGPGRNLVWSQPTAPAWGGVLLRCTGICGQLGCVVLTPCPREPWSCRKRLTQPTPELPGVSWSLVSGHVILHLNKTEVDNVIHLWLAKSQHCGLCSQRLQLSKRPSFGPLLKISRLIEFCGPGWSHCINKSTQSRNRNTSDCL